MLGEKGDRPMLEVEHLTKLYRNSSKAANQDISFSLAPGQMLLLVGPNGAGKSTLMKSILGLLRHEGTVRIEGKALKDPTQTKKVTYVPELPRLYPLLTVGEHMNFMARAFSLRGWEDRAQEYLDRFDLTAKINDLPGALSKGMRQKCSIVLALVPQPDLLILDEPLLGLDPKSIRVLQEILAEEKERGCAFILSTHILATVGELWDQVLVLEGGKVLANVNKEDLLGQDLPLEEYFFQITGQGEGAKEAEGTEEVSAEVDPTDESDPAAKPAPSNEAASSTEEDPA